MISRYALFVSKQELQGLPPTNTADDNVLTAPFGITVDLVSDHSVPVIHAVPQECTECRSFMNAHCIAQAVSSTWRCCFCGTDNAMPADLPLAITSKLDLHGGLHALECRAASHREPSASAPAVPSVLAFDLASPPRQLEMLKRAAIDALITLPDSTEVGLVAYGLAVAVYRLGGEGASPVVNADMFPCANEELQPTVLVRGLHTCLLGGCRRQIVEAITTMRTQKVQSSAAGLATTVYTAYQLTRPAIAMLTSEGLPQSQEMDRVSSSSGTQVLVLTAASAFSDADGLSEEQEESEELLSTMFSEIGDFAEQRNMSINVIAAMHSPLTAAMLDMLAQATGGSLVWHRYSGPSLAANVKSLISRPAGLNCHLEMRLSKGLAVKEALGPMMPLCLGGYAVKPQRKGSKPRDVPRRWLIKQTWHYACDVPEDGRGLTFLLDSSQRKNTTKGAYVQIVLTWMDATGGMVHRIATIKLKPTADGFHDVDATTMAIVWTKALVAEAVQREAALNRMDAEILRRSIGKAVRGFAEQYGLGKEAKSGWLSGPGRLKLPPSLLVVAEALYFYQRCLFLQQYHKGAQASQELWQASMFAASTELATPMCVAAVYTLATATPSTSAAALNQFSGPALELQRVEATDRSVLSSQAAVIDQGTEVFVWLSQSAADNQRVKDACTRLAYELACSRSPAASDVNIVVQGSKEAIEVVDSLNPSSQDAGGERQQPDINGAPTGLSLRRWLREQNVTIAE